MPDAATFDTFIREQARQLRGKDAPPATLEEWKSRRVRLRESMLAALGSVPDKPTPLTPRLVGTLDRKGYRIEKLLLQTRPDVWMSASAYVPTTVKGKVPGVLMVHGHWAGARRDPVIQARCLGLVKLGFFVLAVDAFGAGERHPTAARGGYHGALLGSTLWPAGLTLPGMQIYENRRAVDYLVSRPEVDGARLGITGASGGGNQTMYAGALDERFSAVVPVCSVGNYQAYLRAACCVCEVLPGALRFTEEGDVLGLVAPRSLMVISATRDAFQFSVAEAKRSVARAEAIFKLYGKADHLRHAIFESPHAYNQPMREAMYGWMTRWLKGEGDGKPIPEPAHEVEKAEDLACYPEGKRPAEFLFPSTLAAREASQLLSSFRADKLDHREAWEGRAALMRPTLLKALGGLPPLGKTNKLGKPEGADGVQTTPLELETEPGLSIDVTIRFKATKGKLAGCVLLHLDGRSAALEHPLAKALIAKGHAVYAPDLRATGAAKPARAGIARAVDHNSAEHAVWIGRPLLGQWLTDVRTILAFMALQRGLNPERLSVVGIGQAGVVALVAGAMLEQVGTTALVDAPLSLVTSTAYPEGTRMGLLAPGLFRAGDLPHLAALIAPRQLIVAGGTSSAGAKLDEKGVKAAMAFPEAMYKMLMAQTNLHLKGEMTPEALARLV